MDSPPEADALLPYVPRLLRHWAPTGADERHMQVAGTLAFVDISGFTRLTERLARKGKLGAEEMSELLSVTFAGLLTEAYDDGADLVKWGGDAVLLLFQGADHAARAARAAHRMRARLRVIGHLRSSSGAVALRMSIGIHSGDFDFFLVGDPEIHRELLVCGPAASTTADMEAAAAAGQIGLSAGTAALLPPRVLGPPLGDGRLLRSSPARTDPPARSEPTRGGVRLEVLLPPPIRTLLLGGDTEPEHRLISVAFVAFSGADEIVRSSGTVGLAEALDQLVRNVQDACAAHDVTFFESDIAGDGGKIMLTAGAPRSADHDEERMLRVARLVLDRADELPLRVGINRGHVFAGDFGAPFRRTYSVKGDAINLAARLTAKAPPGQALATLEVLAHSHTAFRVRELAPFPVKGKSGVVRAAEVGELLGTRTGHRSTTPLVGRSEALTALRDALARARSGHGRFAEVVAEPGMGKSRLVSELLADLDDVRAVLAPCEQYESSTPYFPFRRLLREALDVPVDAVPEQVTALVTRRVSMIAPHLVRWLPLLGLAMDVPMPPTRESAELEGQFRKSRLEEVVTQLLAAVLSTPSVLVVEDGHFMDPASADLLRHLSAGVDERPLLVLVTRREDTIAFAPVDDASVLSIRLQPLGDTAALELVQAMLGDRPATPQAASELVARAGGHPMFLEALVLEARRAGSLAALPESVEALVTSQIDRLAPEDRTVVRCAAVLGAVVDEDALDRLLEEQHATVPAGALHRLADLLVRDKDGSLRFRNALIRDVAYEALPFSRRKALHDLVGQALERGSSTPENQCEVLSLHFFHAGRHERSWHYSVLAGERALAKFAHGEAIDFFSRAAQSGVHVDGVEPAALARVHEQLADSLWLVGQTQEAADAYAAARRYVAGDPVLLAGIIEKETRIDQRRRRHSLALRRVSTGLRRLEGVTGAPANVARSLLARRYAQTKFSQDRVREALKWADIAAFEAEESADKGALAQAYEMLNYIYASSGLSEPLPYGRLALQAYLELGNLPRQGHCLNNIAMQEYAGGRWDESLANLRRASDLFRRIGDTAAESNALYNQVELMVRQGRHPEARISLPGVLRTARAMEDEELVALATREQARCLGETGDLDGAMTLLDEVRADFERLQEPTEVRNTDLVRAELLLGADRVVEAGAVLASVSGAGDADGVTSQRLTGDHQLRQGALGEARATLESALQAAEREADRYEEGLVLLSLARLARREGRSDDAVRRRARGVLDSLGVVRTG